MDMVSGEGMWPLPRRALEGEQEQHGTDRWIASGLLRGDEAALATLYDRYQRLIFSVALRMGHDLEAAEELVQEVVMRAWQKASSYQPERGPLAGWLTAIARNLAIDELRRRRHRPPPAAGREVADHLVLDSRHETDPATQLIAGSDRDAVLCALAALPLAQRQVIELAYYRGLSQSQIAALLDTPLGTVKTRARLAARKLRVLLREFLDDPHGERLLAG